MDSQILERIRLLVAATGQVNRKDLKNFPAVIISNERGKLIHQDFNGGRSETEMKLLLQSMLHNLGSFLDYLVAWGQNNAVSANSVKGYLTSSSDYCIVLDLYNREKHGGRPPRGDGYSGHRPEFVRPHSVLKLKTQPKKNSSVSVSMGPHGEPVSYGDGSTEVVVTADVLDKNGNSLGDLDKFIEGGLRRCEDALRHFGVTK